MTDKQKRQEKIAVYSYQDAINQSGMDTGCKILLYVLLSHASLKTKSSFPSVTTLSRETSLHRTTVFEKIIILEKEGFIRRYNRKTPKGLTSNCYETILPSRFALENRPKKMGYFIEEEQGVTLVAQNYHHDDPSSPELPPPSAEPTTLVAHAYTELTYLTYDSNLKEKKQAKKESSPPQANAFVSHPEAVASKGKPTKQKYTSQFETFWNLYPKKINKPEAFKRYETALKKTTPEIIINGLKWDLTQGNISSDPKYQPHASTWIGRERWENMPKKLPNINLPSVGSKKPKPKYER